MAGAYYNELDPFAAQWLRNLMTAGHIPAGDVDERDVRDVDPVDLLGYTQCHWFAGVAAWPYALRLAGWPDDRPVWTGSCPCQPFSTAGKRAGFADERHLWPAWFELVRIFNPPVVLGEQVSGAAALPWLDAVFDDMEGEGYACGAVDLPACGVGAPHIRQRLFWVADAPREQLDGRGHPRSGRGPEPSVGRGALGLADAVRGRPQGRQPAVEAGGGRRSAHPGREGGGLGDPGGAGLPARKCAALVGAGRREEGRATEQPGGTLGGLADAGGDERRQVGKDAGRGGSGSGAEGLEQRPLHGGALDPAGGWMAHADGRDAGTEGMQRGGQHRQQPEDGVACRGAGGAGPLDGFWRDADWLLCRDGRWRPVEPGAFPLAHGVAGRVGRLRAYGNAVNAEAAKEFVSAYLACRP